MIFYDIEYMCQLKNPLNAVLFGAELSRGAAWWELRSSLKLASGITRTAPSFFLSFSYLIYATIS
jgi:hypothetical protein